MRSIVIALSICMLSFVSCEKSSLNKDKPLDASGTTNLSELTIEVISKTTRNSMMQAYNLLSVSEKETLWRTKLNAVLNGKNSHLSKEQLSAVNSINSFLETNGMAGLLANPEIGEAFLQKNLPEWSRLFSEKQLFLLLLSPFYTQNFSIENPDVYLKVSPRNSELELNYQSNLPAQAAGDVAAFSALCNCYYSLGCAGSGSCESAPGGCVAVTSCGLFGTSNCTKVCNGGPNPDPGCTDPNEVWDPIRGCVCKSGYTKVNGKCVSAPPPPQ